MRVVLVVLLSMALPVALSIAGPILLWLQEYALLGRADLGRSLDGRGCLVLPTVVHSSVQRC
jgi:hypothetical protein